MGPSHMGGEPPVTKSCLNHRLRKLLALARNEEKAPEASQQT